MPVCFQISWITQQKALWFCSKTVFRDLPPIGEFCLSYWQTLKDGTNLKKGIQ